MHVMQCRTNLLYNAKDGKNIWANLLGDQKLDEGKPAQILSKMYILNNKLENGNFKSALNSMVWMTYRTGFLPLLDTISASVAGGLDEKAISEATKKLYCSDNGWGCTIRVGQMAIANSIIRHIYKGGFSLQEVEKVGVMITPYANAILGFWDNGKGKKHPFSIQNFAEVVLKYNKVPGEWLSQSTVAIILKELNTKYMPYKDLDVVTFIDGTVFEDQIKDACTFKKSLGLSTIPGDYEFIDVLEYDEFSDKKKEASQGAVIFISCSLGLSEPEEIFLKPLKSLFKLHHLVGIMGGRGNEALFFVGYQDNNFIFFDPHFVQVHIAEYYI